VLYYLATRKHLYTMGVFLEAWCSSLDRNIRMMSYRELTRWRRLPRGPIIFSDIERLTDSQRTLLARVYERLARRGDSARLLNHPTPSLRRYELLRKLHERGTNSFNVYRLHELPQTLNWPVFVRVENDHIGPRTQLLDGPQELHNALRHRSLSRRNREDLLVVEFCQTAGSDGLYRKYAAFYVAGRVIPRHLFFDREFTIKLEAVVTPQTIKEEQLFLRSNPHKDQIKAVFELAHIDYGRIDYGVKDGRMQVWEINTNPMLLVNPDHYSPARMPDQQRFADQIVAEFRRIDGAYHEPGVGSRLSNAMRKLYRGQHSS
jgi:hypothetical protein